MCADGWFSSDSAAVYDTLTETIFLGSQDAMQRSALLPIARCAPPHPLPLFVVGQYPGTCRDL